MSFGPVINALDIPWDARVDQRVPKKLLLEQGAPTAFIDRCQVPGAVSFQPSYGLNPTVLAADCLHADVGPLSPYSPDTWHLKPTVWVRNNPAGPELCSPRRELAPGSCDKTHRAWCS